jgi:hypothetical protein
VRRLLVAACVVPSSTILVTLMKERYVPPKRRFLQELQGVISQKTPFFLLVQIANKMGLQTKLRMALLVETAVT